MTDLCSLRLNAKRSGVDIIDQTLLPHKLEWLGLDSVEAYCESISNMRVRGAPLIGITAAFGLATALLSDSSTAGLKTAKAALLATRPTAINLQWALDKVASQVLPLEDTRRAEAAFECACALREQAIESCSGIGDIGFNILKDLHLERGDQQLQVLGAYGYRHRSKRP